MSTVNMRRSKRNSELKRKRTKKKYLPKYQTAIINEFFFIENNLHCHSGDNKIII